MAIVFIYIFDFKCFVEWKKTSGNTRPIFLHCSVRLFFSLSLPLLSESSFLFYAIWLMWHIHLISGSIDSLHNVIYIVSMHEKSRRRTKVKLNKRIHRQWYEHWNNNNNKIETSLILFHNWQNT